MSATETLPAASPRRIPLGWAFIERQINLWKRYWAWELVWLVYGVVNTLAITFIAAEAGRSGAIGPAGVEELTLFLLVGTLMWAYLAAVLDDMSLVIMWERWEGTIEHTLMTPVSRVVHLVSMALFGIGHAVVRTLLILLCALPFLSVSFTHASWPTAAAVITVGSISLVGLGILTSILPLLYPERGEQMSFMVQAVLLLVSGVYYSIDVLPAWLQPVARAVPTTYMLRGIRAALIDGETIANQAGNLLVLALFGVVLVPLSLLTFAAAERWAKKTGRLKRQG
jgi:ABC-2 type transport system permease protein